MRRYTSFDLTIAAGATQNLDIVGDYFAVVTANHNAFEIGLDDDAPGFAGPGIGYQALKEDEGFKRLRIVNTNASALVLTLQVGLGRFVDNRLSLTGTVTITKAAGLTSSADVSINATTNAQVLASNTARRAAIIQNLDAVATVHIGDVDAAAAEGFRLGPGEKIDLPTTAEIRAYNPTGATVSLSVLEVTD